MWDASTHFKGPKYRQTPHSVFFANLGVPGIAGGKKNEATHLLNIKDLLTLIVKK